MFAEKYPQRLSNSLKMTSGGRASPTEVTLDTESIPPHTGGGSHCGTVQVGARGSRGKNRNEIQRNPIWISWR